MRLLFLALLLFPVNAIADGCRCPGPHMGCADPRCEMIDGDRSRYVHPVTIGPSPAPGVPVFVGFNDSSPWATGGAALAAGAAAGAIAARVKKS